MSESYSAVAATVNSSLVPRGVTFGTCTSLLLLGVAIAVQNRILMNRIAKKFDPNPR